MFVALLSGERPARRMLRIPSAKHYTMISAVLPYGARLTGKRSVFLIIIPYLNRSGLFKREDTGVFLTHHGKLGYKPG